MPNKVLYDEKDLLQQVAEGNEAAFQMLFVRHRAKLFDYLLDIVKSREVAEEIVADVFLKLWFGRELAPEIRHLDAFLFKIGYHKALNFLRITARRRDIQKLVAYEMEVVVFNPAEEKMTNADYKKLLKEAIALLSPQRQLVYNLSREDGLTHQQIADKLGLSPNTVKNHISDATKFIRSFLQDQPVGALGTLALLLLSE